MSGKEIKQLHNFNFPPPHLFGEEKTQSYPVDTTLSTQFLHTTSFWAPFFFIGSMCLS